MNNIIEYVGSAGVIGLGYITAYWLAKKKQIQTEAKMEALEEMLKEVERDCLHCGKGGSTYLRCKRIYKDGNREFENYHRGMTWEVYVQLKKGGIQNG